MLVFSKTIRDEAKQTEILKPMVEFQELGIKENLKGHNNACYLINRNRKQTELWNPHRKIWGLYFSLCQPMIISKFEEFAK